jgi:hypothetical protein
MKRTPRTVLGLALEGRAIAAAAVRLRGGRGVLKAGGRFEIPEAMALERPEELGRALRRWLRGRGLRAKSAVIGVPAGWLVTREHVFPPASHAALAGMVRLEAERRFAGGPAGLVIERGEPTTTEGGQRLLMAAMPRVRLEQLTALARGAGLRLRAVSPTAAALAQGAGPPEGVGVVLAAGPDRAELAVVEDGHLRALRHVPGGAEEAGREAARVLALMPAGEAGPSADWVGVWLSGAAAGARGLAQGLGGNLHEIADPGALGLETGPHMPEEGAEALLGAASLALAGARNGGVPMDFRHSRVEVRRSIRPTRRLAWAAALVLTAVVAGGLLADQWRRDTLELAELRGRLTDLKAPMASAEALVRRVSLVRGWTDRRPRFLDRLRELTLAVPVDAPIWVSSLAVREDMRAVLSGKSRDERSVLELLDRLRAGAAFKDVELLYMRKAGARGSEVAFSIAFSFQRGD